MSWFVSARLFVTIYPSLSPPSANLCQINSTMLFRRHLTTVPGTIPSLLNGKHVLSSTKIPVYSHNSDLIHHYLPIPSLDVLNEVCSDSYNGFLQWSSRPFSERADILNSAADSISRDRDTFIDAHLEIGGSPMFASVCADNAVQDIREYSRSISLPDGLVVKSNTADLAMALKTPMGPVLSIAPWNAPTILWSRAIVAPLAAGCSVIIKSSDKAPKLPFLYTEHLLRAGVDVQALQLLNVNPQDHAKVTESLLANDLVRKVNFTGSTAVGTKIAQTAAKYLKPSLLELGGKNVSIVCYDADIKKAAYSLVLSAWMHKGQICMCLDNVYVHDSIYDKFTEALVTVAKEFAASPDMKLGQRDKAGAEKVSRLVSDAIDKGASVLFGEVSAPTTTESSPLILENVTPDMSINTEETFGPVLALFKYQDVEEVITNVNKSKYGLKGSIWSTDTLKALSLARKMDFGGVHINGSTVHDEATLPHGGVKLSGWGRFNSMWGVDEFTFTKTITLN